MPQYDDEAINQDFGTLFDRLVPFGKQMLEKQGGFIPYGAYYDMNGKLEMLGVHDKDGQAANAIKVLLQSFKHLASQGKCRSIVYCMDIRTVPPGQKEKTDAILATMEHVSGEAMNIAVPYRKEHSGKITYGKPFPGPATAQVFPKTQTKKAWWQFWIC
jgi:hypothetical protein